MTMAASAMDSGSSSRNKLYCFDFDDTVATTGSRIWTVDGPMTTYEYAMKKPLLCGENPFRELYDVDNCELMPAPFHACFIKALVDKSPVAIVTARNNDPVDFRRLATRAAVLGGTNLHEDVYIYCCNSPCWSLPGETREERKCAAILDFVERYPDAVSVGFSDDDMQNFLAVSALFERLSIEVPRLKWRTYACGGAATSVPQ